MNIFTALRQHRAIARAGYTKTQVKTTPSGSMFETATGREICPLSMMPCETHHGPDGTEITFYERNTNTPIGTATGFEGALV